MKVTTASKGPSAVTISTSAVVVRAVDVEGKRSWAWLEPMRWRRRVVFPAPVVPENRMRE
jgi:hypothetical protein